MTDRIKGFLSYSSADRHLAAEVKDAVGTWGVDAFMAHEDIRVSDAWRARIIAELRDMKVFIPLFSKNFKASDWASQEAGAAVIRDVLIIPLRLDLTVPYGFLNHWQAIFLRSPVDPDIFRDVLLRSYPRSVINSLINGLDSAFSFREGEKQMQPLVPLFGQLTSKETNQIADKVITNSQIWDATRCKNEYLPEFLRVVERKLNPKKAERLRDLIGQ